MDPCAPARDPDGALETWTEAPALGWRTWGLGWWPGDPDGDQEICMKALETEWSPGDPDGAMYTC
ncbi:hypothetical protein QR98_0023640, partial [Sarcoptes scabiei]